MMSKKSFAGAVAAGATIIGILSAGSAHADVPAFNAPFLDPGCLCAGLLPGPVVTQPIDTGGTMILGNPAADSGAGVLYFGLPAGQTLTNMGANVEKETGVPVRYGSYRGRPSFTTAPDVKDEGVFISTYFIDGNRVIVLVGAGASVTEAQQCLDTLGNTLQII